LGWVFVATRGVGELVAADQPAKIG
jgi:hypothetical protein